MSKDNGVRVGKTEEQLTSNPAPVEGADRLLTFEEWLNYKPGNIPYEAMSLLQQAVLQSQYRYDKAERLSKQDAKTLSLLSTPQEGLREKIKKLLCDKCRSNSDGEHPMPHCTSEQSEWCYGELSDSILSLLPQGQGWQDKPDKAGWWWVSPHYNEPQMIDVIEYSDGRKLVHYDNHYVPVDYFCSAYLPGCKWLFIPEPPAPKGETK